MTAARHLRVATADAIPTNPTELAALIYNQHTPHLFQRLLDQVGDLTMATRIWWDAADLLEGYYPIPRVLLKMQPRPTDWVFTWSDVDHEVVPQRRVTRCGMDLPLWADLNHPRGVPCTDCFGRQP